MIDSRKIEDLHPVVRAMAEKMIAKCEAEGIKLIITSTYRDFAMQDALYAQGRTKPGKIVTKAKGGQSLHNYRLAFDVVPLRNGKPVWGTKGHDELLWQRVGNIGESVGLEWAGRWKRFKEFPHFQYTGGHPLAYFQKGGKI